MGKKSKDDVETREFSKKWAKLLSEEWMNSTDSKSTDDINKDIVKLEQAISSTEEDMDSDSELNVIIDRLADLKADFKEKSKFYKETITSSQAQIKYLVHVLKSRGVPVSLK